MKLISIISCLGVITLSLSGCSESSSPPLNVQKGSRVVLIGNNLGSRMMNFGHFETEMHVRYPDSLLLIRNMCDGGDTPGFRPHSGRNSPWAFPGAEKFQTELAHPSGSEGHFETPDQWLTRLQADIMLAFFGYNESFQGQEGLENFKGELDAFIKHTLSQKYNGRQPVQLAIVSPIAFEDLSQRYDVPNGERENENLEMYARAMKEVAEKDSVLFVDVFNPTKEWYREIEEPLTIDGFQLNDEGYKKFAVLLANTVFGETAARAGQHRDRIHAAVMEKNWIDRKSVV